VARFDSTYTAADGRFTLKNRTFPDNQSFLVKLRDTDGTTNGSYQDKDTTIVFNNNVYTNGTGWYRGTVSQSVILKLTSK